MTEVQAIIVGGIIGGIMGIGGTYFGYRLTRFDSREIIRITEFNRAASKFKTTVIYELSGFFPIDQHWDEKDFPRLYQSIPRINSAAAEFRSFVVSKAEFDVAIKEYNEYCRKTTYRDISCLDFPSMQKSGDIKPREQFKNIVEHLLSFANKD